MAPARMLAVSCAAATLLTAVIVSSGSSAAAVWVEPRYDPPAGSRWNVVTEYHRDDLTNGKSETLAYRIRSELTIDAKTRGGYRITYVNHEMTVDGSSRNVPVVRAAAIALKGITVRAETDFNGKPLRIDNLAEVQAAMRKGIDLAVAAAGDKPAGAEMFGEMLTRILIVDDRQGATTYLDALPSLAIGHNTGLKIGEERRSIDTSPNPFGGEPMRSNQSLRLVSADPASGRARYLWTEAYDADSVRNMIVEGARQFAVKEGKNGDETTKRVRELMQTIKVEHSERTEIEVEGGMTRRITSDKKSTSAGLGATFDKHEVKVISVTSLP